MGTGGAMFPALMEDKLLHIKRPVHGEAELLVAVGQRVVADEVIARQHGSVPPLVLDITRELEITPADVLKGLAQDFKEPVKAGTALVSLRSGLRRKEFRAPEDGHLVAVDASVGHLVFQPARAVHEIKAHVSGIVENVDEHEGITISTLGTRIQGIWGVGGETVGVLNVLAPAREDELRPQDFDARAAFSVIVGGRGASAEALKRAAAAGVKAIVLGSIAASELRRFLEMNGQVAPRWYVGGPRWSLAAPDPVLPFTLVLTEGFGRLPMSAEVFAALQRCEGREASLVGLTRLRGRARRPEIIVATAGKVEGRPRRPEGVTLREGTRVRLIEPRLVARVGTVRGEPVVRPLSDGLMGAVVEIELDGGARRMAPVSNVEVII